MSDAVEIRPGGWVRGLAASTDGDQILLGMSNGAVFWWRRSDRSLVACDSHGGYAASVAFAADRDMFVTAGPNRAAHIWELR